MQSIKQAILKTIGKTLGNVYVQTALIQLFTLVLLVLIWNSTHLPT